MLSGTTPCTCQDECASEMSNEKGVPSVPTTLKLTCPAMLGVLPGAVLLLVPKAPPHAEIRAQPHAIRAIRTRALIDRIVLHIVMVRYFFLSYGRLIPVVPVHSRHVELVPPQMPEHGVGTEVGTAGVTFSLLPGEASWKRCSLYPSGPAAAQTPNSPPPFPPSAPPPHSTPPPPPSYHTI